MKRITVLLAEDHQMVREGFRSLLARESDIEVVGEAADGHEAVRKTHELGPDLVLLDIGMPERDGIGVLRETRRVSDVAVLMLSAT